LIKQRVINTREQGKKTMSNTEASNETENTESFSEDNYLNRLMLLHAKDPNYPAILAARNVLRIFPCMATENKITKGKRRTTGSIVLSKGDLNQKYNEKISNEKRAKAKSFSSNLSDESASGHEPYNDILAVFLAPLYAVQQVRAESVGSETKKIAEAISANIEAIENAYGTDSIFLEGGSVIKASMHAAASYAAESNHFAASSAANTLINAIEEAPIDVYPAVIKESDHDLTRVEKGMSAKKLANEPLWSADMPQVLIATYQDIFIPLVNEIIKQNHSSNPEVAMALKQLLANYDALIVGQKPTSKSEFTPDGGIAPESSSILEDQLGREDLVNGLTKLLTHKDNTEHMTIGLLGHWGTGKTRILELLKEDIKRTTNTKVKGYIDSYFLSHLGAGKTRTAELLQEDHKANAESAFLFGEFNAWAYEHAKNSQAAMAHEVIKSLTSFQDIKSIKGDTSGPKRLWYSIRNNGLQLLWQTFIRSRITFGFMARKYPIKLVMFSVWVSIIFLSVSYLVTNGISIDFNKVSKADLIRLGLPFTGLFALWRAVKDAKVLLAQPYTKELLSYIKLPDYASQIGEISEMREDIRLMANIRLGTKGPDCKDWLGKFLPTKRLLFVVDDLDRCGPEGIVKTFEAIRLVLDIPQVYVVIAVDQRIALAALALHYEKLRTHHTLNDAKAIARDYLAKMIQLPIVVEDGNKATLQGYLSHLWKDKDKEKQQWFEMLNTDSAKDEESDNGAKPDDEPKKKETEKQIADIDEPNLEDELSDEEIVKQALALPEFKPEVLIKEFTGLQPEHKAAFAYWADRFEITNARQIKRLYNSYNLIRLVSGHEDQLCENTSERFAYGILVALLAIESINSIESAGQRRVCGQFLKKHNNEGDVYSESLPTLSAAKEIILLAANKRYASLDENKRYTALLNFVELFVLPAIDSFDADATEE
jgi:hypothetical protein